MTDTYGPTVAAVIRLDLRRLLATDAHAGDRLIQSAASAPAGATVIIEIGRGQLPPVMAVEYLRRAGRHLGRIVVEGEDVATCAAWLNALRSGVVV